MNQNKNNTKKLFNKKIVILLVVIVFLFVFFQGVVNSTEMILSNVLFPIQKKIYTIGIKINEVTDSITQYKKVLEENRRLNLENIKYDRVVSFNKSLLQENQRLEALLEMKQKEKERLRVARVNFRTPGNLYVKFFIDLGKEDGITLNTIVLYGNTLIGRVGAVYSNYSVVDMITADKCSTSGLTENEMLGIVRGSDESDGTMYFEPNTFDKNIKVGEKIYTSGISDIYPKGLYIGTISEIDENGADLFQSIKVKNDVDIMNMNEVLLLIKKEEVKK